MSTASITLRLPRRRPLSLDRPRIMGILNVTPDSFSDGGQWLDTSAAVRHGLAMAGDGADLIDVGGESTRPGSQRVDAPEQIRRTQPVIAALRQGLDDAGFAEVAISIDTTLSAVALAALDAGADLINDVAAGREDEAILALAARQQCPIILMHMQGTPATMQDAPRYDDVVGEVEAFLLARAAAARKAGVAPDQVVLDPGIGFGKTREHNLALLAALPRLRGHGHALLLGASRKRFMGAICTPTTGPRAGVKPLPQQLVGATCATTAWGITCGVEIFRVHDVLENRQAADLTWSLRAG
jgi:dihydropteroate synthase